MPRPRFAHFVGRWRTRRVVSVVVLFCLITLLTTLTWVGYFTNSGSPDELTLATGTAGGMFHELGSDLAATLTKQNDLGIRFDTRHSKGSGENIRRLLSGDDDLALVDGPSLAHAVKKDPRTADELAVVARLFPSVLQLVVRSKVADEIRQEINSTSRQTNAAEAKVAALKVRRPLELDDFKEWPPSKLPKLPKFFIGAKGSGTRLLAERLLRVYRLREGRDYEIAHDLKEYNEAREKLQLEEIDAAFFFAATPAGVVERSLADECELVEVPYAESIQFVSEATIAARTYATQRDPIASLTSDVYLVGRKDLPTPVVSDVVDVVFDNLTDLLIENTNSREIRLDGVLVSEQDNGHQVALPEGLTAHPGVAEFVENDKENLLIAAGPSGGQYYEYGQHLHQLLTDQKMESTLLQTDGSLENLALLASARPTIALLQYDIALASTLGETKSIYVDTHPQPNLPSTGRDNFHGDEWQIRRVPNLRSIASLHEERLYVFKSKKVRSDLVPAPAQGAPQSAPPAEEAPGLPAAAGGEEKAPNQNKKADKSNDQQTVDELAETELVPNELASLNELDDKDRATPYRVCLGPEFGGSRILAQAVLGRSTREHPNGVELGQPVFLSNEQMVRQLQHGDINVGFIVGGKRNKYVNRLLHDREHIDAISIDGTIDTGPALTYQQVARVTDANDDTEKPLDGKTFGTIGTRTVLVANAAVDEEEAALIAKVVFEKAATLMGLSTNELQRDVRSIPLHAGALAYYQENGYRTKPDRLSVMSFLEWGLGLAVAITSLWTVFVSGRYQISNQALVRRIIGVELNEQNLQSVNQLRDIQVELRERVNKRWWQPGGLSSAKWRSLNDLVEARIAAATGILTRTLVKEINEIEDQEERDSEARSARLAEVKVNSKRLLELGEIQESQYEFLLRLIATRDDEVATEPDSPEIQSCKQLLASLKEADSEEEVEVLATQLKAVKGHYDLVIPALLEIHNDGTDWSKKAAQGILREFRALAVQQLGKSLQSGGDSRVKIAAAWYLREFGRETPPIDLQPATPSAVAAATSDADAEVREAAVRVLEEIEPRTEEIRVTLAKALAEEQTAEVPGEDSESDEAKDA